MQHVVQARAFELVNEEGQVLGSFLLEDGETSLSLTNEGNRGVVSLGTGSFFTRIDEVPVDPGQARGATLFMGEVREGTVHDQVVLTVAKEGAHLEIGERASAVLGAFGEEPNAGVQFESALDSSSPFTTASLVSSPEQAVLDVSYNDERGFETAVDAQGGRSRAMDL